MNGSAFIVQETVTIPDSPNPTHQQPKVVASKATLASQAGASAVANNNCTGGGSSSSKGAVSMIASRHDVEQP
jgi:hypothetical protein